MHRRLPRCDPRRFQKRKQSSVENTQVQSIHRDGICLVHTHQNLFAKLFVQDILMSFPGRGHAYHSQVFWSPNLLNGEQLTCSKAACEGGGTVLRFNCPIVESVAWFVQSQLFRESEWTSPGNSSMLDIWTKCPDQMHIS